MPCKCSTLGNLIAATILLVLAAAEPASAVPPFAAQTGQPCSACHIGAFGPQLTPLGRAFKIEGYTQTGGEGWLSKIPLAAMVIGSFTHTDTAQPDPAAPHFGRNSNPALDQVSVFLAGRITDYAGAFVQGTYDGVGHSFALDNTDLRLTTPLDLGTTDVRLGLSVNNGPTVQDPYNSTFAWIYPFATSNLAPTPAAQPLLAGGLIGNSVGATVYAWYDRSLYLEAGGYWSGAEFREDQKTSLNSTKRTSRSPSLTTIQAGIIACPYRGLVVRTTSLRSRSSTSGIGTRPMNMPKRARFEPADLGGLKRTTSTQLGADHLDRRPRQQHAPDGNPAGGKQAPGLCASRNQQSSTQSGTPRGSSS